MQKQAPMASAIGAVLAAVLVAACGAAAPVASVHSPSAGPTETSASNPSPSPSSSPSAAASPTPPLLPSDIRLVIWDVGATQVRLARLDATDTASISGRYNGVVNGLAIVVNGNLLESLNRAGTVTKLGVLAAAPTGWSRDDTVAVAPDRSQWVYAISDQNSTAQIHLGTAAGDNIIATLPSPDGNAYYRPYAVNRSGVYMVRQGVGLGGAGPFLDYHFPLARFDLATGKVTDVSPGCTAYGVLDDGSLICGLRARGSLELRTPSGGSHLIPVATGGSPTGSVFFQVEISPDQKKFIAARNGAKDPVINYQMTTAVLNSSSAAVQFGPLDFLPDAWLPDGRVVADHTCVYSQWGGGPCDASLDGTYIFSADGASRSLFYKLTHGLVVGYV